jgi:hypothetical protein
MALGALSFSAPGYLRDMSECFHFVWKCSVVITICMLKLVHCFHMAQLSLFLQRVSFRLVAHSFLFKLRFKHVLLKHGLVSGILACVPMPPEWTCTAADIGSVDRRLQRFLRPVEPRGE